MARPMFMPMNIITNRASMPTMDSVIKLIIFLLRKNGFHTVLCGGAFPLYIV